MNWNAYKQLFNDILEKKNTTAPYDKEAYLNFVQLNHARINRWIKKNPIDAETEAVVKSIDAPQKWLLITEPWCGDAAHSTPLIYLLSELNPNITLEVVLRDNSNLIDSYLTKWKIHTEIGGPR